LVQWLKHAFAIESAESFRPTATQEALVDRLARFVVRRGLSAPAVVALECSRNLTFLASQAMTFFSPMLTILFNRAEYLELTHFLERRESSEYVCRRIEHFADHPKAAAGDARRCSPAGGEAESGSAGA